MNDDTAARPVLTQLHVALPAAADEWRAETFTSLAGVERRLDELEGKAAETRLVVLGPSRFAIE